MPRIDQKIGRAAKKVWNGVTGTVQDTFSQTPVNPYDPNRDNYSAFGDQNYAHSQATSNQNAGDQNVNRGYDAEARALNTNNADVSRGMAIGDRGTTLNSVGQIQGDAGNVRGVGDRFVDF